VLVYQRAVFDHYRAPLFEEESFLDWPSYIKLALPTTGLMCIEWWAFEFIVIFAGILGVKELAAQVAIMNVNGFVFMFPLGVQFAASGLVGNQLGKGNQIQAKRFAAMCVAVMLTFTTSLSVMLNVFSEEIAGVFTKDEDTIEIIVDCLPILSIFVLLDAVHGVQAGNVRALGR
jgi:MATE family multidrug resistance protein